ncbi:NAD(P)-binding protein, partial [Aspergillus ellipticus CBS 707.79]
QQIALINAASAAGVKRLVPNAWPVTAPPNDIMICDWKEDVFAYMKKSRVPYTVIDTGVWHEVAIPRVSSGKLDHAGLMGRTFLIGEGETPCAATAIQDIGRFVARIIINPRTINKYVFAYGEHVTQNSFIALAREVTGEDVPYIPVSKKKGLDLAHKPETEDFMVWQKVIVQYLYNNWAKGDNEASYAKYLGYLDARELYPELEVKSLKESMCDAFAGKQGFATQVGDDGFWIGLENLLTDKAAVAA